MLRWCSKPSFDESLPALLLSGYFTSRPTSKGYIRHATSYLQAARQLEAFVGINKTGEAEYEPRITCFLHHLLVH